jgi:hypothetical protein
MALDLSDSVVARRMQPRLRNYLENLREEILSAVLKRFVPTVKTLAWTKRRRPMVQRTSIVELVENLDLSRDTRGWQSPSALPPKGEVNGACQIRRKGPEADEAILAHLR